MGQNGELGSKWLNKDLLSYKRVKQAETILNGRSCVIYSYLTRIYHLKPYIANLSSSPSSTRPMAELALFSVDPATRHPPTRESLFLNIKHILQI